MRVNLIAAVSSNLVIGKEGVIPWSITTDMKRFKELTLSHPVIMGRKTWESLYKPLSGRMNCVVSESAKVFNADMVFSSLEDAILRIQGYANGTVFAGIHNIQDFSECFIIGGTRLYAEGAKYATRVYLTVVDYDCEGDTCFPETIPGRWEVTERKICDGCVFLTLDKTSKDGETRLRGLVKEMGKVLRMKDDILKLEDYIRNGR